MPCYDERNEPKYVIAEARGEFRHNSDVAELLCWTVAHMELPTRAKFLAANPALAKWWKEHQQRDAEKAEAERKKRVLEANAKKIRIAKLEAELKKLR